jgi:molecular chaperone DnaJ
MKDYYAILGVAPEATDAQLKKAFRKAAKAFHPDATGGDKAKESRFKDISEAYDVLSNQEKRAEYDEIRRVAAAGGRAGAGFGDFEGGGIPFDLGELLSRMRSGGFGAETPTGRSGRRRAARRADHDVFSDFFADRAGEDVLSGGLPQEEPSGAVNAELDVDFVDAAKGGTRTLTLDLQRVCSECAGRGGRPERCPTCGGTGMRRTSAGSGVQVAQSCSRCVGRGQIIDRPCPGCGGQKVVQAHETLQVRIPPGVDTGSVIRLRGRGPARQAGRGLEAAHAGDLLLRVKVRPHPHFRREGSDILVDLPISIEEAILGARVAVPTIDGPARLHIPAGSSGGTRLRLRGKGAFRLGQQARGDQYVRVEILVPKDVDEPTAELVRELGRRAPVPLDR